MTNAGGKSPFISTEQLAKMMETLPKGKICVIDATFKPNGDLYREHSENSLPGSIFLDL
jgi:hypothetical protein